jgi:hypothetical protein
VRPDAPSVTNLRFAHRRRLHDDHQCVIRRRPQQRGDVETGGDEHAVHPSQLHTVEVDEGAVVYAVQTQLRLLPTRRRLQPELVPIGPVPVGDPLDRPRVQADVRIRYDVRSPQVVDDAARHPRRQPRVGFAQRTPDAVMPPLVAEEATDLPGLPVERYPHLTRS